MEILEMKLFISLVRDSPHLSTRSHPFVLTIIGHTVNGMLLHQQV
ncbi:hypothetical protein [Laceyella sacchari]|uniref:Uncharacterized protein n=1 Tax=Laceyella sacchari TaxID=37482 RepID=A0ABY5U0U7_LACSH|nr:hypothetical protein [Laceyella sacchari]UWE03249.1 hypothetical protein NYR52_14190 [Laceyella sacchari]